MTYKSQKLQELVAKIEEGNDILTPIEKFCLLTSSPENLGSCLDGVPPRSTVDRRRLKQIAASINGDDGNDPLTPWEKYCLLTSTPEELGGCLDGVPPL